MEEQEDNEEAEWEEEEAYPDIHEGVQCECCFMMSIRGCWQCITCPNFKLCGDCHDNHVYHTHHKFERVLQGTPEIAIKDEAGDEAVEASNA